MIRFAQVFPGLLNWQYLDCMNMHVSVTVVPIKVATQVTPDMAPEVTIE